MRPLLLTLLMWLYAFWAGTAVVALVAFWLGGGPVEINGREVAQDEVLGFLFPIFLPLALASAGAALAVALEKHWARPALVLPFALSVVVPALAADMTGRDPLRDTLFGIGFLSPLFVLLFWYLYVKPDVVAYFRALREREGRP